MSDAEEIKHKWRRNPTKKKLFKCELCNKTFGRKPDLTLHIRFKADIAPEEYYKHYPIPSDVMNEYLRVMVMDKIIVDSLTLCWEWTGGKHGLYGRYGDEFAHRLSYRVFVNAIPKGLFICHKCDNPLCVNPQHLYVGTHQDNMDDRMRVGNYKNFKHTNESKEKISKKLKGKSKPSNFVPSTKNPEVIKKGLETRRSKINYICTSPNGGEYEVGILKEFCIEHNLCGSNIFDVIAGRSKHHKGWVCRKMR